MKTLVLFLVLASTVVQAADRFDVGTEVSFENLNFVHNRGAHGLNDQETLEWQGLLDYQKNETEVYLKPRLKVNFIDSSRNRYIPNEAFIKQGLGSVNVNAGLFLKPQGVSAFFQPTNVLNRRDFEDLFYNPEYLGELMVGASYQKNFFGFELQILPWFQETPLPENDTRFALQNDFGFLTYSKSDNQARLSSYLESVGLFAKASYEWGALDVQGLYYHGPERDPAYFLTTDSSGALRIKPFYYTVDVLGLNSTYTWKDFLFRMELAYKNTARSKFVSHNLAGQRSSVTPSSYFQMVPGLEYTKMIFDQHQATLILEYYFEDNEEIILQEYRPFKNDLFAGILYQFNDRFQNQLSVGVIKDLKNQEVLARASWSVQFYKNFLFELEGMVLRRDPNTQKPFSFFDNNSSIRAKLSYKAVKSFLDINKP